MLPQSFPFVCLVGCFQKYGYPQIIHFNRVFHYKPSVLGYHHFRKPPVGDFLIQNSYSCVCLFLLVIFLINWIPLDSSPFFTCHLGNMFEACSNHQKSKRKFPRSSLPSLRFPRFREIPQSLDLFDPEKFGSSLFDVFRDLAIYNTPGPAKKNTSRVGYR